MDYILNRQRLRMGIGLFFIHRIEWFIASGRFSSFKGEFIMNYIFCFDVLFVELSTISCFFLIVTGFNARMGIFFSFTEYRVIWGLLINNFFGILSSSFKRKNSLVRLIFDTSIFMIHCESYCNTISFLFDVKHVKICVSYYEKAFWSVHIYFLLVLIVYFSSITTISFTGT